MKTFVVTEKSTGKVAYRYQEEAPVEWNEWPFSTHDHTEEVVEAGPAQPPVSRVMTKLAFRRLFTTAERQAIDEFNATFSTNPMLTDEQRRHVRTANADFAEAQDVDLADADTIAGVWLYAALGLIAAGRAEEILNG